jgi:hypothetical protein
VVWFKTDDKLHEHRKVRMLGKAKLPAMGLWILCASWSADNQMDGSCPQVVVKRWDPRCRYAAKLVSSGLWVEETIDGEPGYRFHDWADYQLTADDLDERRKIRAEAGRLGGLKSARVRRAKREANQANGQASASAFASEANEANAQANAKQNEARFRT